MDQYNAITLIRQFNRKYTQYLGVFDKEIFNTDLTWSEARILLEMQLNDLETVTSIAHFLKVDKAYISRIIKKFKKQGLIELVQDKTDGRKQLMHQISETLTARFKDQSVHIIAQTDVQGFYEKWGYIAVGEPYIHNQTPHIDMILDNV
ncbi:MarR family transcriptional regulator [Weissella minor]|uniref:MarR family transcriptional regulator n=1 Tax=Weissella minor TaxID=1620 RepID=UPI003AF29574